jgi:hypothetical protein
VLEEVPQRWRGTIPLVVWVIEEWQLGSPVVGARELPGSEYL